MPSAHFQQLLAIVRGHIHDCHEDLDRQVLGEFADELASALGLEVLHQPDRELARLAFQYRDILG
jgi:hypothetical protein